MYKLILAVAVIALTACGSAKTEETSTADSTTVAAPVADTTVSDSTVVAAPTTGEAAK